MRHNLAATDLQDEVKEALKNRIRNRVLSTLSRSARMDSLRIEDVENPDDFTYAYWMSVILVSGSSVRTNLKIHFNSDAAKQLVGSRVQKKSKSEAQRVCMDFMREQCNLIAGSLKSMYLSENIITGLSLPLLTSGFDEAIFSDRVDEAKNKDIWKIVWDGYPTGITCSAETQILAWDDFKNFSAEEEEDDDNDSDGEFL